MARVPYFGQTMPFTMDCYDFLDGFRTTLCEQHGLKLFQTLTRQENIGKICCNILA